MTTFAIRARRASAVTAAIAIAFTGALVAAPAANAAVFSVTSTADAGVGTLRQAILDANASAGPDVVNITVTGSIGLESTIVITEGVAINGPGLSNLQIIRTQDVEMLLVDMASADQDVSIDGISFDGAAATSVQRGISFINPVFPVRHITITDSDFAVFDAEVDGGVIRVFGASGDLTIDNTDFHDNASTNNSVATIYSTNVAGTTTVSNSAFTGNNGEAGSGMNIQTSQDVVLSNLTFTGNRASNAGGGLTVSDVSSLELVNSAFSDNDSTSNVGGALYVTFVSNFVTIANSTFTNSDTPTLGGAAFIDQVELLEVLDSSFSANSAGNRGGALHLDDNEETLIAGNTFSGNGSGFGGGAIHFASISDEVTIDSNLFDDNISNGDGGAVSFITADENVTIQSNTFSNNQTAGTGGGLAVQSVVESQFFVFQNTFTDNLSPMLFTNGGTSIGVGVIDVEGVVAIANSTFYEPNPLANPIVQVAALLEGPNPIVSGVLVFLSSTFVGYNGVLDVVDNDGTIFTTHSIFNGDLGDVGGTPVFDMNGTVEVAIDYNIFTTAFDATNMVDQGNNRFSIDPQLGALASNAGVTQTMVPLAGSPAINTGDPIYSTRFPQFPTDQRGVGFVRIFNGRVDIGAVELQTLALAATGVEVSPLVPIGAGGILLLGAAALLVARRRQVV